MDFLTLVQRLFSDVNASGTEPTAVTGQQGEALRLVNWTLDADEFIQNLWTRWKYMRATFSENTVATVATIAKPAGLKQWDYETFFIDGDPLAVVEYDKIKSEVLDTSQSQPSRVIIMPDDSLLFEPVPAIVHAITADFYQSHVPMVNNADVSDIPADFHMCIRARAQMLYGNFEEAPEQQRNGAQIYGEFLGRLQDSQLPNEENAQYKGSGGFFEVIAE